MQIKGPRVTNLCFHGIGEPSRVVEQGEEEYWIGTDLFLRVLDEVTHRSDVFLSFDDGNLSDILIAAPALTERGLVADFFPLAGRLGSRGSLDENELRELVASGMFVGTHGMYHKSWRAATGADFKEELALARTILSDVIEAPVTAAACPFGLYDRRVLGRLRSLGYERVLTSDRAFATTDAWLQPRFSIRAGDDLESVRLILTSQPGLASRVNSRARMLVKRWR